MKFGVTVPKKVEEAKLLDIENGNNLRQKAITKEHSKVIVAFMLLEDNKPLPVGSTKIPSHFIFDVKFDLTRKARLVTGGHRHKDTPVHSSYSSVVSIDSVIISFLLAALNDLDILAGDMGNAYLNASCKEKVHVIVKGDLFGPEHEGKRAVIVRALYGLKSAGNAWRHHLANEIRNTLRCIPCKADQDIYMKPKTKNDGTTYYLHIVVYVDNILCIEENPKETMSRIGEIYRMKEDSVGPPRIYLGANIKKWNLQSEDRSISQCWALSSEGYAIEAICIVSALMKKTQSTIYLDT